MDRLSIIGITCAIAAVVGGNYLEGGHIGTLYNSAALVIVFGGTLGAGLLQTPHYDVKRALKMLPWVFRPPATDFDAGITKVMSWTAHARRYGLLGLEQQSESEQDPFLKKGLQLLADGVEQEMIRDIMEVDMNVSEQKDYQASKFFESMGGYAPTIGIIGAVMGLIHVMTNLADPETLGSGIATAFVATVYGVGLANLLLLPMASKLRGVILSEYRYREMMLEGMLSIAQGHNPMSIRVKLDGYMQ